MHIVQNVKCKNNGNQLQNVKKVVETSQRLNEQSFAMRCNVFCNFTNQVTKCVGKAAKILHQNHVENGDTNCIKTQKTISKENPFQNRRKSG